MNIHLSIIEGNFETCKNSESLLIMVPDMKKLLKEFL